MARIFYHRQLSKEASEYARLKIPKKHRYDTLKPLPRREQIKPLDIKELSIPRPAPRDPRPGIILIGYRFLVWVIGLIYCTGGMVIDKFFLHGTIRKRAKRLRKTLEKMGPGAIKVGQQLSIRADLLPYEYCNELTKMLDQMPSFPVAYAIATIERMTGKPLNETFESFDPVPIGSASLACVYQAKLWTGELVAVKIKRPDIARKIAADLRALWWFFQAAEYIGIIRFGMTRNILPELWLMLSEEADFILEARYTEIFRNLAKKNKFVSAPKVYQHLSNEEVIVSEFISGVFLIELINAIDRMDHEAIAKLQARGIDFEKVSKNMFKIFFWETMETEFFHGDPHPANIIVRPDNTLVFIDFGSCGTISEPVKRKILQFNQNMAEENVNAMVQTSISMLEPLPPMDINRFSHQLINIYNNAVIAIKSEKAAWYEKCTGGIYMKILAISREYNISIHLDLVRIFRAAFMYDSVVFRINPELDPRKEFQRWTTARNRKNRQHCIKEMRKRICGPLDEDFTNQQELSKLMRQILHQIQAYADKPKYDFGLEVRKAAFVFSTIIKSTLTCVSFFLLCAMIKLFYQGLASSFRVILDVGEVFAAAKLILVHPLFISFVIIYLYIKLRLIISRMDEVDTP